MKCILFLYLITMLSFYIAYPQTNDTRKINKTINISTLATNPIPKEPKIDMTSSKPFITSLEFILSVSVLIFGLIIVGLEIYLIKTKEIGADMLVKFIVVTLIITGTLFLITAGYNNNQIAPAVGLFGTVAGYLLGKSSSEPNINKNEKT